MNPASELDALDPLASFRDRFYIPRHAGTGRDCVYLTGHSLGLQPKSAAASIAEELDAWKRLAVEGHFHGPHPWTQYHKLMTAQMARVVGAMPVEVVVMNTLTVNLHLMMVSFYRPTAQRHKILIEAGAFPSDRYAIVSQLAFHGYDPASSLIEIAPREGEALLREEDILEQIDRDGDSIALILMPGVNYSSGQAFDLTAITRAGHAKGCVVGFDLAHAAGNLELHLHDSGADFAVWCTYKYLNGGPGSIAACFVHERYAAARDLPRFAGWWGHDEASRFRMGPDFEPIPGAEGWQLSNPPILALAALRASMDLFDEAGIARLRRKSIALTGYMEQLLEQRPSSRFSVITPREPERRGAQLSIRIASEGRALCDRLIKMGIVCDWREPDILRAAPVPLYNTFTDVGAFAEAFLNQVG